MQNVVAINAAGRQGIIIAQSTSDEMLLVAIADGNRTAMHTLYARHNVRVFRFILRMVRNTTTAEDLVSQVFLDVWRTATQFEGRAQVSTWLLSIARFKALTALRQDQRHPARLRRQAVAGSPRDHRPRLLPREVGRRGRRHHRYPAEHGENPDVLCPQATGRPAQERGRRQPGRLIPGERNR
jgi:RNA polymerase sigma factor (sigma-70 family)